MTVPLELFAEVTTADRTRYRWGANQPAGDRPQGLAFRTKIGEGFSDADLALPRRIDQDYPDLNLVDTVSLIGADGTIAYEGRVSALPRDLGDSHSVNVTLTGFMAHAKDRKFSEIYVDRDLNGWQPPGLSRRAQLLVSTTTPYDPSIEGDPTDNVSGVQTAFTGAWTTTGPLSEAWYDAGVGVNVGKIAYSWRRTGSTGTVAPFGWFVGVAQDDKNTGASGTASLVGAGPSTGNLFTAPTTTAYRYGWVRFQYSAAPSGTDGTQYGLQWYKLAVYGTHGLPLYTGQAGEPDGVLASDVIKDVASRFCPLLDVSGVQPSTYVIQHLAFKDRAFPYDAFLEVNKFHLWHLGVWENKTLVFRPYDLTDYQWEIRTDDPGTTFSPQGQSVDDLFNGIEVSFTDVLTGVKNVLTPTTFSELRDTDIENPWNQQGVDHWDSIDLSSPTLQAQALQIGQAALAARNRPKTPGTITVRGYIRDRAGNRQPGWKVRAGDTISITNFPNDSPRLIHETSWDDESKVLTLSIEAPASSMDALFDRIATGLAAANVS